MSNLWNLRILNCVSPYPELRPGPIPLLASRVCRLLIRRVRTVSGPVCGHCFEGIVRPVAFRIAALEVFFEFKMMEMMMHAWQDVDYILKIFIGRPSTAGRQYLEFVEKGIPDGRRHDLTIGGLLRSAGGQAAAKTLHSGESRIKSDERILGNGEFVETVKKRLSGLSLYHEPSRASRTLAARVCNIKGL